MATEDEEYKQFIKQAAAANSKGIRVVTYGCVSAILFGLAAMCGVFALATAGCVKLIMVMFQ